jgi:hypothetical protein
MLEPSTNRDAMGDLEGKEDGAVYRGRTTTFEHAGLTKTSSDYLRASALGLRQPPGPPRLQIALVQ